MCRPSKKEIECRSRISFSVFQQCEKFAGLPSVDESVVYVERYGHRKPIAGPGQFPGGDAGYGVASIGRPGMFHFRKGEPGNSRKIDQIRAPGSRSQTKTVRSLYAFRFPLGRPDEFVQVGKVLEESVAEAAVLASDSRAHVDSVVTDHLPVFDPVSECLDSVCGR